MPGNYARLGVGVKDEASGPLDRIRDKFTKLQKQGGKGFAIGAGAAITAKSLNALSGATDAVIDGVRSSIEAASDQREAMALNDQVFKTSAGIIEDWADTAAKSFGESKTDAIDFAAGFGNTLKAAGLPMDELAKKSIELTERAADLGSAFNKSGEEVATAIKSGLVGESEPLRRFGILLNEAKVNAKGMAMGLGDANGKLSEGEKVLARYELILEESQESAGMFGRDVDSLADKQKILNARWEDAQAKLGGALLPKVTELAEGLLSVGDAIEVVASNLGPAEEAVMSWVDVMASAFRPDKVIEFAQGIHRSAEEIADDLRGTSEVAEYMSDHVKDDLYTAGQSSTKMAEKVDQSTERVKKSWEEMVDTLEEQVGRLIDEVHDPAIIRADIAANAEEDAALRKIIASKNSTDAEIKDAKRRRLRVAKEADELRLDLLETGEMTAEETEKWLKDLEKDYEKSTGEGRRDIQRLIDKIKELRAQAKKGVTVNAWTGFTTSGGSVPGFDKGGIVPGPKGKPMFAVVHGGEEVLTPEQQAAPVKGGDTHYYLTVMGNLTAPNEAAVLQTMRRLQAVASSTWEPRDVNG